MPALFPQTILPNPLIVLNETNGTTARTIITGTSNGIKVHTLKAFNNCILDKTIILTLNNGTDEAILIKMIVPAGTSVNLLSDIFIPGIANDGSLLLGENILLKVKTLTLPAAGETVDIIAEVSSY